MFLESRGTEVSGVVVVHHRKQNKGQFVIFEILDCGSLPLGGQEGKVQGYLDFLYPFAWDSRFWQTSERYRLLDSALCLLLLNLSFANFKGICNLHCKSAGSSRSKLGTSSGSEQVLGEVCIEVHWRETWNRYRMENLWYGLRQAGGPPRCSNIVPHSRILCP